MISLNVQPMELPDMQPDGSLEIVNIWETIQGEGPLAGRPATFVRLAGCSLTCNLCDTDYTTGRNRLSVPSLMDEVGKRHQRLIVLTGGEPMRQNITLFISTLIGSGYDVQIETNGIHSLPDNWAYFSRLWIVCSPKTPKIRLKEYEVNAYKYILRAGYVDPNDGLPTEALGGNGAPYRPVHTLAEREFIYVQPCDERDEQKNKVNTEATIATCMKFGYRFCPQVHKLFGLE